MNHFHRARSIWENYYKNSSYEENISSSPTKGQSSAMARGFPKQKIKNKKDEFAR